MARIKVGSVASNLPNAPGVAAPASAFGPSGEGMKQAGQDLGAVATDLKNEERQVAQKMQAAEEKLKTRGETLDRLRLTKDFYRELTDSAAAVETEMDISNPATLTAAGEKNRALMQQYLSRHQGSEESRLMLETELEKQNAEVGQRLAKASIAAQKGMLDAVVGEDVSALAYQAGQTPGAIPDLFRQLDARVSNLGPAISTNDADTYIRTGRSQIVKSAVDGFIARGDIATAQDVLENTPGIARILTPEDARSLRTAVMTAQKSMFNEPMEVVERPDGSRVYVPRSQSAGMRAPSNRPVLTPDEQARAEFLSGMSKKDAERVSEIEVAADSAARTKAEVTRITAALDSGRFTPGVFSDARQFLARLAEFTGSDELVKVVGDAATADTLDAASKRLGIELADRMGRVTNMSLQFVVDAIPGLSRTEEGNRIIAETLDRTADREIEIANLTENFLQENNGNPRPKGKRSLFQMIRDLEEKSPVIDDELQKRIIDGSRKAPKSFKDVIKDIGTAAAGAAGKAATPKTRADVEALAPGTKFINPADGKEYTKK